MRHGISGFDGLALFFVVLPVTLLTVWAAIVKYLAAAAFQQCWPDPL
jgi:hypothetical protein